MSANKGLLILQEIVWLCIAGAVGAFVVFPLHSKIDYNFVIVNFVLSAYAVLLFRWVFFFKSIPWLKPKWVRFALFAFSVNAFVFIVNSEQKFLSAYNSFLISDLGEPRKTLSLIETEKLFHYFYTEIHLIVVSCLILIVLFVIRLIASYWSLARTRLYSDNKFETES